MPLPKPKKDETQKDFIGRCMSIIADEFPNQEQRTAVCYDLWNKKKKANEFRFGMKIKESKLVSRNSKKFGKTEKRIVIGYAATYDVFKNGQTLQITREALEMAKDDLLEYNTVLFNHDITRPIGHITETAVDETGLLVKMLLSNEEDEIWNKVKDGTISKMSFQGEIPFDGYEIIEASPEPIMQVNVIKLKEAGLVSVPGNVKAETLTHYIEESIDRAEMLNAKKQINNSETSDIFVNEEIKEEISDKDKEYLNSLLIRIQNIDKIISSLQILGGKLSVSDRDELLRAISLLKDMVQIKNEIETNPVEDVAEYDMTDKSEDRPIFQLNNEITEMIEMSDEKNRFRKQILKYGKWYHWNAPGGVLKIDEKIVDNIIKNFKSRVIENVFVPLTHTDDPSKNTGKVVRLEKTATGLDAIIEIKEESIAEKIKNGLIKCISASIDPNYRDKKRNTFLGATLLHAALVAEPFIKGMSKFIPLSDNSFQQRPVLMLEDEQPDMYSVLKSIDNKLRVIEESINEESSKNKMKNKKDKINEEETEKEIIENSDTAEETENEEEKNEIKEEDKKEDIVIEESKKTEYQKCMSDEMKKGKEMADAAKICKIKIKEQIKEKYGVEFSDFEIEEQSMEKEEKENIEEAEEKTEAVEEKGDEKQEEVDLAEVEEKYNVYLKEGKIVPAQKNAFISLCSLSKSINLGDNKANITEIIDTFMANQPKVINFQEEGTQGTQVQPKEEIKEEIPSSVKEFYSKMGLSDDNIQKSWEYAKQMKEEENASKEGSIF